MHNRCRKSFQWEYSYRAWLPDVKEQIVTQTLNSSGVRDISRNLGIAKNTVIKKVPSDCHLAYAENLRQRMSPGIDVAICTEADESWSYVGDKSNQRWTWYAIERQTGIVLAHQNGKRTDAMCKELVKKLQVFPIRSYSTDNWQSYAKYLPSPQHHIGKYQTWKIERTNLNFRTHLKRLHRKTMCFSKDERLHDTVIGLYIEHHYYKKFSYSKT